MFGLRAVKEFCVITYETGLLVSVDSYDMIAFASALEDGMMWAEALGENLEVRNNKREILAYIPFSDPWEERACA